MESLQVITTADGSHSLLNTALQETYHSVHGAVRESTHVFIDHGLRVAEQAHPGKVIRVLEIGFGTGLNAVLTFIEAKRQGLTVYYESWELHPLPENIVGQLNYGVVLGDEAGFKAVHDAPWNTEVNLTPLFTLYKVQKNLLKDALQGAFDVIYYDAFAPSKQPEMWTPEVLRKVTDHLAPGGIWVTYCAKGQVKRDLASFGLTVETLPGPPGKKEMIRATRSFAS